MTDMLMRRWLVTDNDIDGAGSAVVAKRVFKDDVTIKACGRKNADEAIISLLKKVDKMPDESGVADLYITDLCPSQRIAEMIEARHATGKLIVRLLDHHETADWVNQYSWAQAKEGPCGTALLFQALHERVLPDKYDDPDRVDDLREFVEAVNAYDNLKTGDEHFVRGGDLNRLMWFVGINDFVSQYTRDLRSDLGDGDYSQITYFLRREQRRDVDDVFSRQVKGHDGFLDARDNRYMVVVSDRHMSTIARAVMDTRPMIQYVVVIRPMSNQVSLRSREGGVNVAEIAAKFNGGGGHPNAAGFSLVARETLKALVSGQLLLP